MRTLFLTEGQVAHQLAVSLATVRRWRRKEMGPPFRKLVPSGSVRYCSEQLAVWIESQPAGGDPAAK